MRLADELQELGAHAFVLHHVTATLHNFHSRTSPLKVRSSHFLVEDWERLIGRDAFLIPSNWGAGRVARDVARRHPGVTLSSILQDREDRFEDRNGVAVGMKDYQSFLDIGRGVAVSGWILDSAAEDLGLNRPAYQVIPNGVDRNLFYPRSGKRPDGPVRILAMWRPQTDVRRGIRLLREVYDELNRRYGAGVSLELFGWDAPEGPGKAPSYGGRLTHHGLLSPRQVGALMAQVDVLLEPSLYQGFGLPGLEAMASGAVLCSTTCRGVDEYARHEENALVVPHAKLAAAAVRLVEDTELRARLREGGLETAPRFSWPAIGARWAIYLADLAEEVGATAWRPELERMREHALARLGAAKEM
jgi:glycosyltransferase involved in cell wall biosynthesis